MFVTSSRKQKTDLVRLTLGTALLVLGWAFLASGLYSLVALARQLPGPSASSLAAAWGFLFSFAATSLAILVASRAALLSRPIVRMAFLSSLVASSFLGLGCLGLASLSSFLGP